MSIIHITTSIPKQSRSGRIYNNGDTSTSTFSSVSIGSGNDGTIISSNLIGLTSTDATYLGFNAGYSFSGNTNLNTFIGAGAGYTNTNGYSNTYIGHNAGYNNNGNRNVFIGYCAGTGITSLSDTLYINNSYGYTDTPLIYGGFYLAGLQDAFLKVNGKLYLPQLTNATQTYALYLNPSTKEVTYGTASGGGSLSGITSSDNTLYGYQAGSKILSSLNTLIGIQAGYNLTAGDSNTFIGSYAGYGCVTGNTNVFIGKQAGYNETGSNKLYIANSSTSTPLIWGDFNTKQLKVNGTIIAYRYGSSAVLPAITFDKPGSYAAGIGSDGTSMRVRYGTCALDGSSWNLRESSGVTHFFDGNIQTNGYVYLSGLTSESLSNVVVYNDTTKKLNYYPLSSINVGSANYAGYTFTTYGITDVDSQTTTYQYFDSGDPSNVWLVNDGSLKVCVDYSTYSYSSQLLNGVAASNYALKSNVLALTGGTISGDFSTNGKVYLSGITSDATPTNILYYNPTTKQITYGSGGASANYMPKSGGTFTGGITGTTGYFSSSLLCNNTKALRTGDETNGGYCYMAEGFILQWGTYSSNSDATITVSFPITFPNACLTVVTTEWMSSGVIAKYTSYFTIDRCNSVDTTQNREWIAIGY